MAKNWTDGKDVVATMYRICLPEGVYEIMDRLDSEVGIEQCLFSLLDRIPGVDRADYGEHMGDTMTLWIEKEEDNKKTWALIEDKINRYIEKES